MKELAWLFAASCMAFAFWFTGRSAFGQWFDLLVLWPSFKRQADSIEQARHGFLVHMALDPAWEEAKKWDSERLGDFVRSRLK